MKRYLRQFLINSVSLWATKSLLADGVKLSEGLKPLAYTAFVLTVVNLIIRPLIKLLLLPVNLLTLGAFRWLVNVGTLYFVTLIVPELKISGFMFPGFNYNGFIFPSLYLGTLWVFVFASFLISLVSTFLFWLCK